MVSCWIPEDTLCAKPLDSVTCADSSWQKLLEPFLRGNGRAVNPFPWAKRLSSREREIFYRELEEAFGGDDPDWEEIAEIVAAWEQEAPEDSSDPVADDPILYQVVMSGRCRNMLEKAPPTVREVVQGVLTDFLIRNPTSFAEAGPGKLKKFVELGMVFQYQLPSGYRLRYRVDEAARRVEVEYLGPHG